MRSPMADDDDLGRSLWEKPIREGVWPYLDAMDTVCSGMCQRSVGRTVSFFSS